jgi:integrase
MLLLLYGLRRGEVLAPRAALGQAWQDMGLVFTTRPGRPIEPRNLVRSFHRICTAHGLRDIKVHHLRHTTATLLKNLRVPARDAQLILGHSRLAVTPEIYTHEDRQAQHDALGKLSAELGYDNREEPGRD